MHIEGYSKGDKKLKMAGTQMEGDRWYRKGE